MFEIVFNNLIEKHDDFMDDDNFIASQQVDNVINHWDRVIKMNLNHMETFSMMIKTIMAVIKVTNPDEIKGYAAGISIVSDYFTGE